MIKSLYYHKHTDTMIVIKKLPRLIRRKISRISDKTKMAVKTILAKREGVIFLKPNYLLKNTLKDSSVVVDVGCGFDADLSVALIKKYNLKSIGMDPTKKHRDPLKELEDEMKGNFKHIPLAVTAYGGKISFNESETNVSGSILNGHKNIRNNPSRTYEVDSLRLKDIPKYIGAEKIDYIKLDVEGAEYEILDTAGKDDLGGYVQIFIEFHHHCVSPFTQQDTFNTVRKMKEKGFDNFTLDNHNYLFFKNNE